MIEAAYLHLCGGAQLEFCCGNPVFDSDLSYALAYYFIVDPCDVLQGEWWTLHFVLMHLLYMRKTWSPFTDSAKCRQFVTHNSVLRDKYCIS